LLDVLSTFYWNGGEGAREGGANVSYFVGAQFISAPPIYRPGKGIDGLLADKSAMCANKLCAYERLGVVSIMS